MEVIFMFKGLLATNITALNTSSVHIRKNQEFVPFNSIQIYRIPPYF